MDRLRGSPAGRNNCCKGAQNARRGRLYRCRLMMLCVVCLYGRDLCCWGSRSDGCRRKERLRGILIVLTELRDLVEMEEVSRNVEERYTGAGRGRPWARRTCCSSRWRPWRWQARRGCVYVGKESRRSVAARSW